MIDEEKLKEDLLKDGKLNSDLLDEVVRSLKQWQATIDGVKDYIFVTDREMRIRRANIAFAARFGKHPREIVGKPLHDLMDVDLPHPECGVDGEGESGAPVSKEIKLGDETYVISLFPAKYGDSEVCVFVMKDITEIINLRNKLYHSYKIASLGLLVSGVAHEINNPLTGILGFTELLNMKTTDEAVKRELQKIYKAAERCKHVVESLMCFSRQQAPHRTLEHINSIIDKTVELRSYWLRRNDVELVKEYGNVPLSYLDSQQLQQVILNMIMNAEDAIAEAGTKGRIAVTTGYDKDKDRILIRISDNGAGIPEENLPKVFDPFFTTKPVNKGTGLGLSISYGIISEHGGDVRVESREGEGTTFIIELPRK